MLNIIVDSPTVARALISRDTLRHFLKHDEADFEEQLKALSIREGVVVCYKNKIRIKRLTGVGWYQLSGYWSDGSDLRRALAHLRTAEACVLHAKHTRSKRA